MRNAILGFLTATVWYGAMAADSTEVTLAADGVAAYAIVCPARDAVAQAAGRQLQQYLEILSDGAQFPLLSDTETPTGPFIRVESVGTGNAIPEGRAGVQIAVQDGNIHLTGTDPMDAVMTFLEGDLHCRFFTASIRKLPKARTLRVNVTPRTEVADFAERLVLTDYDLILNDTAWARENRVMSWEHFRHPQEWFCHTYGKVLPMADFAATPELFAVVADQPSNTMLCPSNPEIVRRFREQVAQMMTKYPDKKYFSVSENDGSYPPCQCPRCQERIDAAGGARIAPHLELVNAVARSVADHAPKQLVEFLVYSHDFRQPPAGMTIEPNVNMWYCVNVNEPMTDPAGRERFQSWRKLVNHATVWEYGPDFSNYFHIVPSLDRLAGDLRFFRTAGADGVMIMDVYGVKGGDQQHLRAWVLAQLLWNSSLDVDRLAREYCDGVYGPAASERYAYYQLVQAAERAGKNIEEFYGIGEFCARSRELFETALAKAAAAPEAMAELELDYLPILIAELDTIYAAYPANAEQFPTGRYQELLSRVRDIAARRRVDRISGLTSITGYLKEREALLTLQENQGALEVYAVDGRLYGYPETDDPKAKGGHVTRQETDGNWLVQWVIPVNLLAPGNPYQFSAEMRLERDSKAAGVCGMGLYDETARKLITLDLAAGSEFSTQEYRFRNFGTPFTPEPGHRYYIFFTAPATGDIGAFYVNRIRLVPVR